MGEAQTHPDVWLVTGGAGYIGGHTVPRLLAAGHRVVVFDDLSSGLTQRVPEGVPLVHASVLDESALTAALVEFGVTGVIHFAGLKSVPESVEDPILYYRQNVGGMISLLGAMVRAGTQKLVISSSAAVYGEENHDTGIEAGTDGGLSFFIQDRQQGAVMIRGPVKTWPPESRKTVGTILQFF